MGSKIEQSNIMLGCEIIKHRGHRDGTASLILVLQEKNRVSHKVAILRMVLNQYKCFPGEEALGEKKFSSGNIEL